MQIDKKAIQDRLRKADFTGIFTQELGWDFPPGNLTLTIAGKQFQLEAVAEKKGLVAYVCPARAGESLPDYATRRKIEREVTKHCHQHLIVFTDANKTTQVWQWVRRELGKPAACREHPYHVTQPGDALIQKLAALAVSLQEEESLTHVEVTGKVKKAFDVDKVTKRFYDRFQKEHAAFLKFLKGIPDEDMQRWYVSVMLNRLMFIYFIQSKGFLGDGNRDYLRTKLAESKRRGRDRYYREFLCPLFFEGFAKRPHERSDTTNALLGTVPYLNGGLFLRHQIEELHGEEIRIPDAAFEKLFEFFHGYHWHLDERPLRADNEINPDVLGYIFEKYVNQKQMGAYYTKEDITEYIAKNTIIPFLFDATAKKCPADFAADAPVWQLLREDPDRYIYPAVRHGVVRAFPSASGRGAGGEAEVLPESELPDFVQTGMHDPKARMFDKRFNLEQAPAGDPIRLVTETWREYMYRRNRCLELRRKLAAGEVHQINDLITLNLDIRQFAQDAIANCQSPELLAAFFDSIRNVTVLDPTCGSGAFLFAALNILEPLYEACLDRMEAFLSPLPLAEEGQRVRGPGVRAGRPTPKQRVLDDFRQTLKSVHDEHPNAKYFIFKSIIIRNLFGVDIMEEATEICKLRLFLKLVAQVDPDPTKPNLGVEPLPDIDFNIRAGNTLVGYTTIDEIRRSHQARYPGFPLTEVQKLEVQAQSVAKLYSLFCRLQTNGSKGETTPEELADAKNSLRREQQRLADELDRYLAGDYGIDPDNPERAKDYERWRKSHQPFHWFVEFHGIMHRGGFDVIIGNPPYVNSRKVVKDYNVKNLATAGCPDIYSWCVERASALCSAVSRCGMIVPLSLTFSEDFAMLRNILYRSFQRNWFSTYGRIPSALFAHDVRIRNTIHIGSRTEKGVPMAFTTRLHRWFEHERPLLFSLLQYAPFNPLAWNSRIPKLNTARLIAAFEKHLPHASARVGTLVANHPTKWKLHFKKTAYNWLNFCIKLPPCFDEAGKPVPHTKFGDVFFREEHVRDLAFLLLNGKLEFAFWIAVGDDFDLTKWMWADLPLGPHLLPEDKQKELLPIAPELAAAMQEAVSFKLNAGRRVGNYNLARCRHVTDRSDAIFAEHFGFADVWDDIELLCCQVIRTDFDDDDQ